MLYQNKYQIEDQVKSTLNESKTGHIKCIIEKSSKDSTKYSYLVLSNDNKYFIESEKFIKLIKKVSTEGYSSSAGKKKAIKEAYGFETCLDVGDVVTFRNGPIGQYTVSSIIEMGYGEELWHYELIPISYGNLSTDESCICGRLLLEFQYHDANWERYFTEGTRQRSLPQWRGELYNFYVFYNDFGPNKELDYDSMEEYNNDTIPPMFMNHILDEHSIFRRIDVVLSNDDNADKIMVRLNIDNSELGNLVRSIKNKINRRNLSDMDLSVKKEWEGSSKKFDFTGDELNFISEIDKLDIVTENHVKITKDHYPVDMTNLQIMKAIKEAYDNADDMKGVIMQSVKDWRTVAKYGKSKPEVVDPIKGKRKYRGVAKNGLTIEFWYNFDLDLIETAYPVRMNNNSQKH